MGRHRRSAARNAAARRTAAPTDYPPRAHRGAHRRRSRGSGYVRAGLLGVSAAAVIGVVAVASGVLPGGDWYSIGGDDGSGQVRSLGTPSGLDTMGGTDGPAHTTTAHPDRDAAGGPADRSSAPGSRTAHPSASSRSAPHTPKAPAPVPSATEKTVPRTPSDTPKARPTSSAPQTPGSAERGAEAQVLTLVNQARDSSGCSTLRSNTALAHLAESFSEQMADEGFFDHTDLEGESPWARAAKAGITNLGGENIARGQADAKAVMDSWMASPGHRANILNCDYKTIGIGVHFGSGGPWWTQDFGF
jgi:uncharacterized protein YkwD